VTGTGPRIAAASAAVVVSAAVAGAALFGGSATRNPSVPLNHDQQPAAIPSTPAVSPEMTPSGSTRPADGDSTARECIVQQTGSECDRQSEHRLTATAITRSTTNPGTARTAGERRATSNPTGKNPRTKQTKAPRSARAKTAAPTPPGHTKRPKG
jgi:hypothetical protein